jgi:hypothetical protein
VSARLCVGWDENDMYPVIMLGVRLFPFVYVQSWHSPVDPFKKDVSLSDEVLSDGPAACLHKRIEIFRNLKFDANPFRSSDPQPTAAAKKETSCVLSWLSP